MANLLFTTPTLFNGITRYFDPAISFMINGSVYEKGAYRVIVANGNQPFTEPRYAVVSLVSLDNEGLIIVAPKPCYRWSVNGLSYSNPTLLEQAIYGAITKEAEANNTAIALQEISDKLPQPKLQVNHYSANGTIIFPANTQTSITIKAVSDLLVDINGNIETIFADDVVTFSTEFILASAVSVTGEYYIVALGDKII